VMLRHNGSLEMNPRRGIMTVPETAVEIGPSAVVVRREGGGLGTGRGGEEGKGEGHKEREKEKDKGDVSPLSGRSVKGG
ncbi:hypothetical protein E4U51_000817, partial [Claviceps purpurea]